MAGLKEWFKQDWVDIGSKKKGGVSINVEENLQVDQSESIQSACLLQKQASMTESQRRSAVARKRSKAQGVGGKPTNVPTFAKKESHDGWIYGQKNGS